MNRIKHIFQTRSEKVIPFIAAGYPSKKDTVNLVLAAEESGAAMVELGMPFSDPLADGPVIQEASQIAINNGVNIAGIIATVKEIRKSSQIPLALMGYINPLLKYGLEEFIQDCSAAGVDGLILPDLPPEEAEEYLTLCKSEDLCPILLVAPNTPSERIQEISKAANVLIYCVSILGITGGKGAAQQELENYLKRVEAYSSCPFVVGFGIKNRADVVRINQMAHGAVIGSAIIEEMRKKKNSVAVMKSYISKITKGNH